MHWVTAQCWISPQAGNGSGDGRARYAGSVGNVVEKPEHACKDNMRRVLSSPKRQHSSSSTIAHACHTWNGIRSDTVESGWSAESSCLRAGSFELDGTIREQHAARSGAGCTAIAMRSNEISLGS